MTPDIFVNFANERKRSFNAQTAKLFIEFEKKKPESLADNN